MRATGHPPHGVAVTVAACLAVAAASLVLPHEPVYDAWAWLVWGRELAGLEVDVSSGPSWKPLPVLLTALLSPAGDAAPALWLVLVRSAWLFGLVLAGALAYRLSADLPRPARIAGAAFAALSLLLLADAFTAWTRQGAAGMSEPLLVALVLGAIATALHGRARATLALGLLAALIRPEAWPLLVAFGLWSWRAEPTLRPWLAAAAVALPALWLGPELLSSGGAANAGERALRGGGEPLHELFEVFERVAVMPLLAVWPLAALAVAQPRARAPRMLAAGAAGWIAVVVVLAVTIAQVPQRAAEIPDALAQDADRARSHDRLRELVRAIGTPRLVACGKLATSHVLARTALAWELDLPLPDVVSFGVAPTQSGAFVVEAGAKRRQADLAARAELLGRRGEWRVYSLDCPRSGAAVSSSSASVRSTGVSGALR